MLQDRKINMSSQTFKSKKAVLVGNRQGSSKHLILKPNYAKTSCHKNSKSFSTLMSQTLNKTSTNHTHTTQIKSKNKVSHKNQIKKQIQKLISALQFKDFHSIINKQNIGIEWFKNIEQINKNVHNQQIRCLLKTVQTGYRHYFENQNKKQLSKHKKSSKLSLNIGKINKQDIIDYHDEFMGKINEFSPSWRQMLKLEKKNSC